jgi:hypothetical protein
MNYQLRIKRWVYKYIIRGLPTIFTEENIIEDNRTVKMIKSKNESSKRV